LRNGTADSTGTAEPGTAKERKPHFRHKLTAALITKFLDKTISCLYIKTMSVFLMDTLYRMHRF
jgi:hypothetical protein